MVGSLVDEHILNATGKSLHLTEENEENEPVVGNIILLKAMLGHTV